MAGFTGMDIEGVRNLATQMKQKADEITQISTQLTAALKGAQWVGPDRTQFESDWDGQCVAQLKAVSDRLNEASTRANQNAQQQEQASNA